MNEIKRHNDNRLDELEVAMLDNFEPIDCPVTHKFTNGMYIREIFMPAGTLLTSKIHKTQHPYTVSLGVVAVSIDGGEWYEISAPYTGITEPGTRRVLYIMEDCVWSTYHPLSDMKSEYNNLSDEEKEKIVEKIEEQILEPHINFLSNSNINTEYKELLNSNKKIEL